MRIALGVEGEGDEDIAADGGRDADEAGPAVASSSSAGTVAAFGQDEVGSRIRDMGRRLWERCRCGYVHGGGMIRFFAKREESPKGVWREKAYEGLRLRVGGGKSLLLLSHGGENKN